MMGQKASWRADFRGLQKNQSSCITSYMRACTHTSARMHTDAHTQHTYTWLHAVSPRRLVRAAVEPPPAERLRRLHAAHVDIFVAFNHQTLSGRIHEQRRHLSTPPLFIRAHTAASRPSTLFSCDPESLPPHFIPPSL